MAQGPPAQQGVTLLVDSPKLLSGIAAT